MIIGRINSRKSQLLHEILSAMDSPSENGFIIEGAKFIADCKPDQIKTVFLTDGKRYAEIASKFLNVYEVNQSVSDKISSAVSGQDVIALAFKKSQEQPKKLVLLDDVQDSGNVGTIIRTASAFGFGVLVSLASANPYSVKTVRSSAGAILSCFIGRTDLQNKINELKKDGYYIYSAELALSATHLENVKAPEKFAVVIGNESSGVRKEISTLANEKIYIPIEKENSLNASVAAGITMYVMGK